MSEFKERITVYYLDHAYKRQVDQLLSKVWQEMSEFKERITVYYLDHATRDAIKSQNFIYF